MNDHVHILVLPSHNKVEYIVGQLKSASTQALNLVPTPWARGCWKIFINDREALDSAIDYIESNPTKANLPLQNWDFVQKLPDNPGDFV